MVALAAPWTRGAPVAEENGNIVHQATRYAATAPAVPFLVEPAVARDTRARALAG
jgi:hypothetical protein